MDYSLLKELKNVGMPQGTGNYVCPCGLKEEHILKTNGETGVRLLCPDGNEVKNEAVVYEPTLEELIEWCGESFGELVYFGGEVPWGAREYALNDANPYVRSRTPSEAVARLGLAIHKK